MSDDAIPAATVIIVRENGEQVPEILMVERAAGMAFAGGAWVFPGGRIDEADRTLGDRFAIDGAARIAAVREALEETAIPVGLTPVPSSDLSADLQRELLAGRALEDLTGEHGLNLSLDALTPLARWVPRFHATRRFDTLFYVARAPDGDWQPNVLEHECAGAHWTTATNALDRDSRGEIQLIFPTRRTLERLAQHSSFDEIVADAGSHAIEPISPWVEEIDGERFITIPEGIGFPVTREKLEGLWRG
ncbi:NUDIX domain-containing protein [Sphingomonas daechungensis]|uniref:NUDIX domain-containing protein n=1 Tax=Sphingomonas daechungensis TaxID=1176646 RepID=UPI003784434A